VARWATTIATPPKPSADQPLTPGDAFPQERRGHDCGHARAATRRSVPPAGRHAACIAVNTPARYPPCSSTPATDRCATCAASRATARAARADRQHQCEHEPEAQQQEGHRLGVGQAELRAMNPVLQRKTNVQGIQWTQTPLAALYSIPCGTSVSLVIRLTRCL